MIISNGLGAIVVSLAVTGFGLPSMGASTNRVKMEDVRGDLGKLTALKEDPLDKEKVEYVTSGKSNYDEVSKSSAHIRAGMIVSNSYANALTSDLKGYARSYAASKAADENVKGIVGSSKPEALSDDQAVALLKLKKKQGQLSGDEKAFAANAVVDSAVVVSYLHTTATKAQPLAAKAASLTHTVNSDFAGTEAIKAPIVAKSLTGSAAQMKEAAVKAPELAKSLTRLAMSLKGLE